ncbi:MULTISPECIES: MATE family efflux transporter [unclassified Fusibacter]|uniref:MATE family efflux transporter n=1 Tax=unclassified Fusibacter TaxID=2624464 RepID=UPI0010106F56|nr:MULTISPECIES: MATE family efflux transporter [unclassified Fusibacter]MCK8060604.1 MATE family efflux transporter [Fusibacter sp. A2]NPE22942.1 MATE family efflux transporter [Fusibacter sp. A1]RXV60009.1 MATE family efflux transporter [Fusibacter sp. A1]
MDKRDLILKGNIGKAILTLAIPIMLNNLIQTFYNLTDTYFVSKLGTVEMASMQFIWPLIWFMMSLGMGLSIGGVALISQYFGAGKFVKAKEHAGQLITIALIGGTAFGLIGAVFSDVIVASMGAEGELLALSSTYLRIMFIGLPSVFLFFAFSAIKQGEGDTKTPMIISGLSVVLNIILDPIFIFGFGWGIAGAAIATVLSRTVFLAVAWVLLFKKPSEHMKLVAHDLKLQGHMVKSILSIGMPAAIGQSMTSLGFVVLNMFLLGYGEAILTAFAIGNRISSLIFMPAGGIAGALTAIIGQNIGAGQIKRANQAFLKSVWYSSLIMGIGAIVMFFFTEQSVEIFTKDPYIIEQSSYYLKMILVTIPLFGFYNCLIGLFQGSGHTISAMVIMMGRLWGLRIPMILVMRAFDYKEAVGIWYAMILSNVIIVVIGLLMYLTGKWREPVVSKKEERIKAAIKEIG